MYNYLSRIEKYSSVINGLTSSKCFSAILLLINKTYDFPRIEFVIKFLSIWNSQSTMDVSVPRSNRTTSHFVELIFSSCILVDLTRDEKLIILYHVCFRPQNLQVVLFYTRTTLFKFWCRVLLFVGTLTWTWRNIIFFLLRLLFIPANIFY